MKNWEIKNIREEKDLLRFLSVIREAFGTVADDFGFTRESNPTNAAFISEKDLVSLSEKSNCYGLFADGIPAGFFALEKGNETVWYLEKLCVHPSCRHKGLGSCLLDRAFEEAAVLGAEELSIGIINENTVLKKWYRDYGFSETGTKVFPHLPFTVCFMKKRVPAD